jgi:predicted MFS family arabinose efflux permease
MMLPTIPFLLKRTPAQNDQGSRASLEMSAGQRQWTRSEMLRDVRFLMIAPLMMSMSAIFTGIIFHQTYLIGTAKGWDFFWWSICFVAFAICQVIGSFITGWLIDRTTARWITPYVLAPFTVSLTLLAVCENELWAVAVLGAMGLSAGATNPSFAALPVELYGTRDLGAIRAVSAVLMVFGSALGPVVVGWALDAAVNIEAIAWVSVAITIGTSSLAWLGLRRA